MRNVAARSVQPIVGTKAREPLDILDRMGKNHRAYGVLLCLCRRHPERVDRDALIRMGAFAAQGPVCGPAAFEFWLIQLNIDLPRIGWRIGEHAESYRLEKL